MTASIRNNLLAVNTSRHLTAHYARLSDSVRRLSTGLRVERAADDAAGLAIRELMRADVASLHQGARNVNDAISLIQTADGALGVIDEKLIRMKELAEQAATGTYDSTQRLMIDSEFQQMASEIERIARATDFNGIYLLDGSLSGPHDGSGMEATGALKIHFGTGNDSAEDYYYIQIGDATLAGLGLMDGVETAGNNQNAGTGGTGGTGGATTIGGIPILSDKVTQNTTQQFKSGVISFAIIPAGSTNITIKIDDAAQNDDINIFTRDGKHIAGTFVQNWAPFTPVLPQDVVSEKNGFLSTAVYDGTYLNGTGTELQFNGPDVLHNISYNGMNIGYSGNGNSLFFPGDSHETLTIDKATEDLIIIIGGMGIFDITANWTTMPAPGTQPGPTPGGDPTQPVDPALPNAEGGTPMSIKTQELAQKGIVRINDAIVRKDQIRSHLGAVQNRLENTVANLNIQAENLQAAESRISDVDVATEMTTFIRNQILSQTATAMLSQANSFPHMLMQLIGE